MATVAIGPLARIAIELSQSIVMASKLFGLLSNCEYLLIKRVNYMPYVMTYDFVFLFIA